MTTTGARSDELEEVELDLVIIGGGVAGLWTLNRAAAAGYGAVLLEKGELGGGQSIHAQGIIHGGLKYALGGALTEAANAIAKMPARWRDCLAGEGELDLSSVGVLSDATWLWPRDRLGAGVAAMLAAHTLRSRVDRVTETRPIAFENPEFRGPLSRLDELVLDLPSLFEALAAPVAASVFRVDAAELAFRFDEGGIEIPLREFGIALRPIRIVVAAGEGFAELAGPLGLDRPTLQRRPLHMVVVKHDRDLPVFGHCIGAASTPLLTITTHPASDGKQVWYMGGGLAESGVGRDGVAQIAAAKEALSEALPWIDPLHGDWASFPIDRAEPEQRGLVRPDHAFAEAVGNCIVAWPTKLALTPDFADRVLALLPPPSHREFDASCLGKWPRPTIARPPWETLLP